MLKRTITGAVIAIITVGFFLLRQFVDARFFLLLIFGITLLASYEINKLLGEKTTTFQKAICITSVVVANLLNFFFGKEFGSSCMTITYLVFACVLMLVCVFNSEKFKLENLCYSIFALCYPAVLLIPLTLMNGLSDKISFFALVLAFSISPCADVFAYLVGRTFKGKKLCPSISPNKTISGAIGGLIGGLAGSILVYAILKDSINYHFSTNPYVYFGIVGLIASALTELGDLVESFIKRSLDVKDSGNIFPGHGGMLDRIDGLIFASVFIYFVSALF